MIMADSTVAKTC